MPANEASRAQRITVVGMGASAGGIDALRTFFAAVPPDLNVAYVVVIHLAPDHQSELAAILGRSTRMSVVEVRDHQHFELRANCVYVIAPDRKLVIDGTTIAAGTFSDVRERRAAIDVFFRSLAESYGEGFAVILSGGGSDGALGARAVKGPAASCSSRIRAKRRTRRCRGPSSRPRSPTSWRPWPSSS
jgi:two-component system CheB/CheR fusion protein